MARSKPESKVGADRARQFKLTSFNPIKGLTPARLSTYLDAWKRGTLREIALVWQDIMERDDQVKTCHPKRTRNVTGLDYAVLPVDDSAEAGLHKEALEAFYSNLTAVNALELNERGGVRLLFKHMMTAVGMRYACHEIVWEPGARNKLKAQFRFLPLQFFENMTGRLRFLESDFALLGTDLDEFFGPGGWMVTTGEGIMHATCVAYMFKHMPLKAWVSYCEKFGVPGIHAKTSAAKGSAEWNALIDAVAGFGEDLALITNDGASINPIELKNSGNQPHPALVERMDRAISRLWMGGDLATMSASGSAVGSQPQSDDLEQLKRDDADMITDTLQEYVDKQVIAQTFGADVAPLAYFKLKPPARLDIERELKIDQSLIGWGVEIGVRDLRERYGRSEPDAADEIAHPPVAAASPFGAGGPPRLNAQNESVSRQDTFRANALKELTQAQASALRPLVDRLNAILALPDAKIDGALEALKRDLPQINRVILKDAQTQLAFEKILGAAMAAGMADGRAAVTPPPAP